MGVDGDRDVIVIFEEARRYRGLVVHREKRPSEMKLSWGKVGVKGFLCG